MIFLKTALGLALFWIALTLVVQSSSNEKINQFGSAEESNTALIIYDPDPFYNFDEQICTNFAEGLSAEGWSAKVMTVSSAYKIKEEFDLYVFCANTYNFAPDWAISNYIRNHIYLENKPVIAITLGAGTTDRAQKILEKKLAAKEGRLIGSEAYWLMRPNDESITDDTPNIEIALDKAKQFGQSIGKQRLGANDF